MNDDRRCAPIGVFDSGVGGISVLAALTRMMPEEDFIYFGDSANAPYGEKSTAQVAQCARNVVEKLLDMGAKAIVIACNTATSAAARLLRESYPELPIIGMEPAVKPAALSAGHPTVLVMATPLTIRETKLRDLIECYSDRADFVKVPCHGLVELVEQGMTDGEELESLLAAILEPYLRDRHIDAAVLGCTHYIHVRSSIQRMLGASVKIFDGADGTARETKKRLAEAGLSAPAEREGRVYIHNSSKEKESELLELSRKLLIKAPEK